MSTDNIIRKDELEAWYNRLNNIRQKSGITLGTVNTPSVDKVLASDINEMITQLTSISSNEYLNYGWDNNLQNVSQEEIITQLPKTKIEQQLQRYENICANFLTRAVGDQTRTFTDTTFSTMITGYFTCTTLGESTSTFSTQSCITESDKTTTQTNKTQTNSTNTTKKTRSDSTNSTFSFGGQGGFSTNTVFSTGTRNHGQATRVSFGVRSDSTKKTFGDSTNSTCRTTDFTTRSTSNQTKTDATFSCITNGTCSTFSTFNWSTNATLLTNSFSTLSDSTNTTFNDATCSTNAVIIR